MTTLRVCLLAITTCGVFQVPSSTPIDQLVANCTPCRGTWATHCSWIGLHCMMPPAFTSAVLMLCPHPPWSQSLLSCWRGICAWTGVAHGDDLALIIDVFTIFHTHFIYISPHHPTPHSFNNVSSCWPLARLILDSFPSPIPSYPSPIPSYPSPTPSYPSPIPSYPSPTHSDTSHTHFKASQINLPTFSAIARPPLEISNLIGQTTRGLRSYH